MQVGERGSLSVPVTSFALKHHRGKLLEPHEIISWEVDPKQPLSVSRSYTLGHFAVAVLVRSACPHVKFLGSEAKRAARVGEMEKFLGTDLGSGPRGGPTFMLTISGCSQKSCAGALRQSFSGRLHSITTFQPTENPALRRTSIPEPTYLGAQVGPTSMEGNGAHDDMLASARALNKSDAQQAGTGCPILCPTETVPAS